MPKLIQEIANKVFSRAYRGYDEREVDAFLDDLTNAIERYESELDTLRGGGAARTAKEALDALSADNPADYQLGQARTLLNGVIDDLERIMDNAAAEAERIVESANAQGARLVEAANAEAARILDDAKAGTTAIFDEARAEAERIVDAANEAAAERMRRADREAENMLVDAGRISKPRIELDIPDEPRAKHAADSVRAAAAAAGREEALIGELTKRINELTKRLESIEGTEAKGKEAAQVREDWIPADQREKTEQRQAPIGRHPREEEQPPQLYRRPYGGEGSEAFLSAFNREEYRSATHAPWTDWLPGNTSPDDADTDADRARFTDPDAGDWNTVD